MLEMRMDDQYLKGLVGRKVQVFKGGPESKRGTLVDVRRDYLVLLTENEGVIYYQLKHLKSVVEDSQRILLATTNARQDNCHMEEGQTFLQLLGRLRGRNIQVNQGGPEKGTGQLLEVKGDYFVLQTREGMVYYTIEHVKSVQELPMKPGAKQDENERSYESLISAPDFSCVLTFSKHRWVRINQGGPESIEGVLVDNAGDHITLIHQQNVFRIAKFHIKSIGFGPKSKKEQNANEKKQDGNQAEGNEGANQAQSDGKGAGQQNQKNDRQQQGDEKGKGHGEGNDQDVQGKGNGAGRKNHGGQQGEARGKGHGGNHEQGQQGEGKGKGHGGNHEQGQQGEARGRGHDGNHEQGQRNADNEQLHVGYKIDEQPIEESIVVAHSGNPGLQLQAEEESTGYAGKPNSKQNKSAEKEKKMKKDKEKGKEKDKSHRSVSNATKNEDEQLVVGRQSDSRRRETNTTAVLRDMINLNQVERLIDKLNQRYTNNQTQDKNQTRRPRR